jgi:phage replication-related protein YjqB (UPF0714/DUF867 family)
MRAGARHFVFRESKVPYIQALFGIVFETQMDKYRSYQQLRMDEREGRDFVIYARQGSSGVAVIAPHGGGIEPGTTEVAEAIAGKLHSLYCFEGIKRNKNFDLHISSEYFDEPMGLDLVTGSRIVLALHGCSDHGDAVYLGGRDMDLIADLAGALTKAGFNAGLSPRPEIEGKSVHNICNRGRSGKGVQVEISRSMRKRMFKDITRAGRKTTTPVFDTFVSVLRDVLSPSADKP